MTIQAIYHKYQIMPNLQTHMYRVTAVAETICENFTQPINSQEVITACLLHDMGNIIKFDLAKFPDLITSESVHFWQVVQQQFREKYGVDEHAASVAIVCEIGVSPRVTELVDAVGFSQVLEVAEGDDFAKKICEYADDRVTPWGVTSLNERLADLEQRYHAKYPSPADQRRRQEFARLAEQMEQQIFAHCTLQPGDLSNQVINARLEKLQNFEIIPGNAEVAKW